MKLSSAAFLLVSMAIPSGAASDGLHHDRPMSRQMQTAMNDVAQMCSMDVSRLCSVSDNLFSMAAPVMRTTATSPDPFIDFLLNPLAPPPPTMDFPNILDDIMNTALTMSQQPGFVVMISHTTEHPPAAAEEEEAPNKPEEATAEQVMDSMVSALADRVANSQKENKNMDPVALSKLVVEHGHDVLEHELDDPEKRRLARRLTEVGPEIFRPRPHHPRLPFGFVQNQCLISAFSEGAVSPSCGHAIKHVERVHEMEVAHHASAVKHESDTFLSFTLLYAVLAIMTVYMLHRRFHKVGSKMREHGRLKQRILQAVYSNPRIKEAIQSELGEDIGYVPPLPPHVLARMGGRELHGPGFIACRIVKVIAFLLVLVLAFINPILAMPLLCVFTLLRCCHLTCCPPGAPVHECSCCCCAATTELAEKGELTKEQVCCSCCQGTGVCAPACADCCGDKPSGTCTCCENLDCECCSGSSPNKQDDEVKSCADCCSDNECVLDPNCHQDSGCCDDETPKESEKDVFVGVPIQVV